MTTAEHIWQAPPTVPLLQWLVRGPLKQNLLQAIRLWVWLHLLYGEAGQRLELADPFTYADWRDRFFSVTHPTGEKKPDHSDPNCPCNRSAATWLFGLTSNPTQTDWESSHQLGTQRQSEITAFAKALKAHDQLPDNLEKLLTTPLFAKTRRTLYGDLRSLTSISWLHQTGQSFRRVETWPETPQQETVMSRHAADAIAFLTQPDLAAIAENLSKEIGGDRRFFVHVDYVVPQPKIDRVDDWQALLAEIWQQSPIPPVQLLYQSAGNSQVVPVVVYPVCIYYFQRGPYLCAFGQVPNSSQITLDWRNYRLDRILKITPFPWEHTEIPHDLQQRYAVKSLPNPDEIAIRMEEAWGFDYYQPAKDLLLRFDKEWDDRYIRDSVRHSTFKQVTLTEAQNLIQQCLSDVEQQRLLTLLRRRSPQDAYYTATYRENDPNVHQRLRAWRPHVEVLLPLSLRQHFAREVQAEANLYKEF
ncbi:MAG: TIGR03985 family CRISPR-associated protein [Cyanobacteria bacterium P01_H01_bin.152]